MLVTSNNPARFCVDSAGDDEYTVLCPSQDKFWTVGKPVEPRDEVKGQLPLP